MTMISADDLARMRTQADELLDTSCTIQSATAASDSMGGETYTWATASAGVPCRLNRYDRREDPRMYGERQHIAADWVVTMAHDATVNIDQRIVVGGLTLEPVWINTDKSVKAATRVVCRELT